MKNSKKELRLISMLLSNSKATYNLAVKLASNIEVKNYTLKVLLNRINYLTESERIYFIDTLKMFYIFNDEKIISNKKSFSVALNLKIFSKFECLPESMLNFKGSKYKNLYISFQITLYDSIKDLVFFNWLQNLDYKNVNISLSRFQSHVPDVYKLSLKLKPSNQTLLTFIRGEIFNFSDIFISCKRVVFVDCIIYSYVGFENIKADKIIFFMPENLVFDNEIFENKNVKVLKFLNFNYKIEFNSKTPNYNLKYLEFYISNKKHTWFVSNNSISNFKELKVIKITMCPLNDYQFLKDLDKIKSLKIVILHFIIEDKNDDLLVDDKVNQIFNLKLNFKLKIKKLDYMSVNMKTS